MMQFPELGFYALPGHVDDPKKIFDEVQVADDLGLGSVWISERMNTKEIGVLSGIALARSKRLAIVSGLIANLTLRNPLVIAAYASTMSKLSDGRFALGLGRGVNAVADSTGTARLTFKIIEDYIDIMRRLWRGETVNYEGPAGNLRGLSLGITLEQTPPIIMAVMGPKTAYWAGRICDGVLYTSLWSKRAIEESTRQVRQGARDAGRDPKSVKIWTILITACEVPEKIVLESVIRRINTQIIFPAAFDVICEANNWDKEAAARIRAHLAQEQVGSQRPGLVGDEALSRELSDLRRTRDLYPDEWIQQGCAVGTAEECARAMLDRFNAGADGVLFHGSTPHNLAPLLQEWSKHRPEVRFDGRSANPCL